MRITTACFLITFLIGAGSRAFGQEPKVGALRAAAKGAPDDAGSGLVLGRALRRAGRYPEALIELRRSSQLASGRSGETGTALRYEMARVFIDTRKFQEALTACKGVGASAGAEALGHACAAQAHMIRKRATDAIPEVELALRSSPGLYEAKLAEGGALALQGSTAAAEQAFRDAIAKDPSRSEAHVGLGELLRVAGRSEDALAELRKGRSVDPDDPDAALALGAALPPSPEAIDALLAAVSARPTLGAAWARLAEVRLTLGQAAEAEKAALSATKIDPKEGEWHATLARAYLLQGRDDEAISEARATLVHLPNEAHAKLVEADALAHKGEIDLATEAYQLAFGYARTDPAALVHAALACLAAGRETSAKGFADRATQLFPKSAAAWAALGDVLVKAKETEKARQAFQSALTGEGPFDRQAVQRKLAALR